MGAEDQVSATQIGSRLASVLARIEVAKKRSKFQQRVQLVAVSKRHSPTRMVEFINACRAQHSAPSVVFGENYVQEWDKKHQELRADLASTWDSTIRVDLIGALQRNKVARAVALFDVIQTVHSVSLLEAISKEATKQKKCQEIFLQVNVSRDPEKSGFDVTEVSQAIQAVTTLPAISLRGLMTITREYEDPEGARLDFRALRELRDMLDPGLELSMGMSADFEVAIEEGATLVRVGTALFGERT